jgi:hypothetical protein
MSSAQFDVDLRDLAARTIASEGRPETPFGTYVFGPDEPAAELARHIERNVFDEEYGNSPELMEAEYGPYEAGSIFLCVLDHRRSLPVGMMRLLFPGVCGLKSVDDLRRIWGVGIDEAATRTGLDFDAARACDVATLAVAPGYRQGLITTALCQGLGMTTAATDVRWLVSILDVRVLRLLQLRLNKLFFEFDSVEPLRYLDSPASLPVWCDLPAYINRLRHENSVLYETMFEGTGLEPALSPLDPSRVSELVAHSNRAAGAVAAA